MFAKSVRPQSKILGQMNWPTKTFDSCMSQKQSMDRQHLHAFAHFSDPMEFCCIQLELEPRKLTTSSLRLVRCVLQGDVLCGYGRLGRLSGGFVVIHEWKWCQETVGSSGTWRVCKFSRWLISWLLATILLYRLYYTCKISLPLSSTISDLPYQPSRRFKPP